MNETSISMSTANDNLNRILGLLQNDIKFAKTGLYGAEDDTRINTDANEADEVFFTGTFQELFGSYMNGNLGRDRALTNTMLQSYETVSRELYVDRDGVMGVDLNDEAMNLMMYQKSYQAACRLMTTWDSMIDRLINGTAV